jgi:hypothetical protein
MRTVLFIFALLLCSESLAPADEPFRTDDYRISHSDVACFFDSISFDKGEWRFELSRNSMCLLWRTTTEKPEKFDFTGVCNYKQTLIAPDGATLELKGQDFVLSFLHFESGRFCVRARLMPEFRAAFKNRTREATALIPKSDGTYIVVMGID